MMKIYYWLKRICKKRKTKIFHIGYKKADEKELYNQGVEYLFFPTKPFIEDDDIIGMWMRIKEQLEKNRPHIIIIQFHKPQMMNEWEYNLLCKFGTVINLSDV